MLFRVNQAASVLVTRFGLFIFICVVCFNCTYYFCYLTFKIILNLPDL